MNKKLSMIVIVLLVVIAIILLLIFSKSLSIQNQGYKKILCAKDVGSIERYHTNNLQICIEDCANYCPKVNMKYYKSSIIGNENCGIDWGTLEGTNCSGRSDCIENACECYCK